MLKAGVVQPSTPGWSSFPVLDRRKGGEEVRSCFHYRAQNEATIKDVYPLPRIENYMDMETGLVFYNWMPTGRIEESLMIGEKPQWLINMAYSIIFGLQFIWNISQGYEYSVSRSEPEYNSIVLRRSDGSR